MWDSAGEQKWTKDEIHREVIDAYANLPYLKSEITNKTVVTNAYQFNNLFSNKACRNVYLFIEKDASNKIFIKPGELYENLNM